MKIKLIPLILFLILLSSFAFGSTDEFYIDDIVSGWYLNDTEHPLVTFNSTVAVKDTYLLNNGTLYGKTFNHGTNNGATLHNNLTGTITGATWTYDSELGRDVLSFDGFDDTLQITPPSEIKFKELTISVRAKQKSTPDSFDKIIGQYDGSNRIYLQSSTTQGRYQWQLGSGTSATYSITEVNDVWVTYQLVLNNGNADMYRNGIYDKSFAYSNLDHITEFEIGSFKPTTSFQDWWNGSISDVIILDKALTSDEVLELYNTGQVNTTGYYHEINFPLDEGTGTEVYTKEGKFGGYYEFDGTDYIEMNSNFKLYNSTYCFQASFNDFNANRNIIQGDSSYPRLQIRNNAKALMYFSSENYLYSSLLTANTSYHMCAVIDTNSTNSHWYVDGVLSDNLRVFSNSAIINDMKYIGSASNSILGDIDEVKIWNRALTQAEIQEEMNSNAVANPEGIVAYYDFNEETGTIVYDNNHLTTGARQNINSIDDPVFKWDKAINFDGVDDSVVISDDNSLDISNGTISLWFKDNFLDTDKLLVAKAESTSDESWAIARQTGGRLRFSTYPDGTDSSISGVTYTGINFGEWYNAVFVKDGFNKYIYVNGNLVASGTDSLNGLFSSTSDIRIGNYRTQSNRYFNGSIADVRIYDRALTQAEILTLYNGLKRVNFTGREYISNSSIDNFEVQTLYGNKTTTEGSLTLDVPYGDIDYTWLNTEGYYNQTNTVDIQTQDVIYIYGNNSNITYEFNEYVYGNILPQLKLVPVAFPTQTITYSITGQTITKQLVAGNYYADIYVDGVKLSRKTITITEGVNSINLSDTGMNYIYFIDAKTDLPLQNKNVNVTYPSSTKLELTTNSQGYINFTTFQSQALEYGNYTIDYEGEQGYVSPLELTYEATVLPFNQTYNISRATININVYDRATNELLNTSTVRLILVGIFDVTTNNGTYSRNNISITQAIYSLYVSATGYATTVKQFEFTNQEVITQNIYLLNETSAGNLIVTAYDDNFYKQIGVNIRLQEYFPLEDNFIEIGSCYSDSNGQCVFKVELGTKIYRAYASQNKSGVYSEGYSSNFGSFVNLDYTEFPIYLLTSTQDNLAIEQDLIINAYNTTLVNNVSYLTANWNDLNSNSHEICIGYYEITSFNNELLVQESCGTGSSGTINVIGGYLLNRTKHYKAKIYTDLGTVYYSFDYVATPVQTLTDYYIILIVFLIVASISLSLYLKNLLFFSIGTIVTAILTKIMLGSYLSGTAVSIIVVLNIFLIYLGSKTNDNDAV